MFIRGLGAVFRALVVCGVIAFPSLALLDASVFELDIFVVIGLLAAFFVFTEYVARAPSFIEFRLAPPYNRYRMCCLVLVSTFIVIAMNPTGSVGPVFDIIYAISNGSVFILQPLFSPAQYFVNAFGPISADLQTDIYVWASGALMVGLVSSLVLAIILWFQSWPLGKDGFNLWPNMPSFNTRAGVRTETRMIRFAIASLLFVVLMPFCIAAVLTWVRNWMLLDFTQNKVLLFWLIAIWAMIPSMSLFRALALLKVAFMINHLRRL